jgi:DNA-binding MarR family transcriptional regulator
MASKREALNTLIDELFQLNGRILTAGDKMSAAYGLTGARWQVLAALHLEARPLTVAQIARRMGLQRQSVQRLSDILVEHGMLAYHPNPEHKRAKLVDFTPKGRELYGQLEATEWQWADSLVSGFSTRELAEATEVLRRLREKLA